MMKRFFVTMAVAVFVVFASGSYAGEEPMMNDTAMNMTMNDTMMNMIKNETDMANDTTAEEEPASSDNGRRRLLGEMMDDMANMTMNETDITLPFTLRRQHMSGVGRREWIVNNTMVKLNPDETAIIVVDMWDVHWCHTATSRVAKLAVPMNQTLSAARAAGIHIIFAPSDVTGFYYDSPARLRTLAAPKATLPPFNPKYSKVPQFPLSTRTDSGCEADDRKGMPWTRQIATLHIDDDVDYLIAADSQELYNIIRKEGLKNLLYMGVHENMCIMNRPFGIKRVAGWGWQPDRMAVVRELVDVMYTPNDSPYVSHAEGLELHTEYVEKFWASSVSMYDILVPGYAHVRP